MKYLVAQKADFKFPVLFPDMLTHSSVAAGLVAEDKCRITSAGFFTLIRKVVITHGLSASLKLSPSPGDADLIRDWLEFGDSFSIMSQAAALDPSNPSDPSDSAPSASL